MQAQPGWRDALIGEPVRWDAGTFEPECLPVPVKEGGQDLALAPDEGDDCTSLTPLPGGE